MPGMLTAKQMEALRQAKGARVRSAIFDRDDSASQRRAGYGEGSVRYLRGQDRMPDLFNFATDADNTHTGRDQNYAGHAGAKTR